MKTQVINYKRTTKRKLSTYRVNSLMKLRFDMGLTLAEIQFVSGLCPNTIMKYTGTHKHSYV